MRYSGGDTVVYDAVVGNVIEHHGLTADSGVQRNSRSGGGRNGVGLLSVDGVNDVERGLVVSELYVCRFIGHSHYRDLCHELRVVLCSVVVHRLVGYHPLAAVLDVLHPILPVCRNLVLVIIIQIIRNISVPFLYAVERGNAHALGLERNVVCCCSVLESIPHGSVLVVGSVRVGGEPCSGNEVEKDTVLASVPFLVCKDRDLIFEKFGAPLNGFVFLIVFLSLIHI